MVKITNCNYKFSVNVQ